MASAAPPSAAMSVGDIAVGVFLNAVRNMSWLPPATCSPRTAFTDLLLSMKFGVSGHARMVRVPTSMTLGSHVSISLS